MWLAAASLILVSNIVAAIIIGAALRRPVQAARAERSAELSLVIARRWLRLVYRCYKLRQLQAVWAGIGHLLNRFPSSLRGRLRQAL